MLFDIDGDGKLERISWITAASGFLAIDLNHDGKIDSGRELFGSGMLDRNGQPFSDGFAALRSFDDNHDGVIDSKDRVFDQLLIWRDANLNGRVDPGELKNLRDYGITAIYLDAKPVDDDSAIRKGSGAKVKLVASYAKQNSTERFLMGDIYFDRITDK